MIWKRRRIRWNSISLVLRHCSARVPQEDHQLRGRIRGKFCPTSTNGPGSLRDLWHQSITAGKPLQSLQNRHCNSDYISGRYVPRSTTARPSECRCKSASPTTQPPHPTTSLPTSQGDPLDDSPLPNISSSRHRCCRARQAAVR